MLWCELAFVVVAKVVSSVSEQNYLDERSAMAIFREAATANPAPNQSLNLMSRANIYSSDLTVSMSNVLERFFRGLEG
jgi:hypothetical protein